MITQQRKKEIHKKFRDSEKGRVSMKKDNNSLKARERYKRYYQSEKGVKMRRNTAYRLMYGITLNEYENLLQKQNNSCLICKSSPTKEKLFAVDHCHKTKKIRGLLCGSCNKGLGFFKDDIKLLKSAINYLKQNDIVI